MLTYTQTDTEKRDELFRDRDELIRQLSSIVNRADYIRACKKAKSFPFDYFAHFKSRSGNRYTFIVTPTDKKKGSANPLFSVYTTMESDEGRYMLRYDMFNNHVNIFTPHFFKRYRERYLKRSTASAEETITTFALNNPNVAVSDEKGVQTCSDGYILSKLIDEGVSVCVTFLSFELLRDEQAETSEQLLEVIRKHEDSLEINT